MSEQAEYPQSRARLAGFLYSLVFATGIYALFRLPGRMAANLIATCATSR